jgi:hypothetical protein
MKTHRERETDDEAFLSKEVVPTEADDEEKNKTAVFFLICGSAD